MLQRAASNAYSWWWASHIRTKQSKWMEQNLQDMEEKVKNAIKLIEEDGDSFAKRAEMYYKKRPELISFVEESYKAYRALAERYDHISTELQNANNTIASAFPDRVPFIDEDDDIGSSPRSPKKTPPEGYKTNVPKPPLRDLKSVITAAAAANKKLNSKKTTTSSVASKVPKSGLSRKEALEEVDKLHKQILSLQTVKEFVKSSYDNAIARYWETEEMIKELQEKVSVLQDELGEGIVIEDDEARRLMAEAALKSCQETLEQLEVKQERSVDETKVESERIKEVKAKLASLMNEFEYDQSKSKDPRVKRDVRSVAEGKDLEDGEAKLTQQRHDLQLLQETVKEHFEASSHSSLAATEMAEKIDELVNKVIRLETSVSSQTALVNRLRTETDELQGLVRNREDDKESLIEDKNKLNDQLREMEQKMLAVQDLKQTVEDQNSNLQTHFTDARSSIDRLSVEVQSLQPSEEVKVADSPKVQESSSDQNESKHELEGKVPLNEEDNVLTKSEEEHADLLNEKVTSDNKIMVTDSPQNGVDTENNLKVPNTLETEGTTSVENKPPEELKEQEKALNPGESNGKETVALSTITTTGSSESLEKLQENDGEKGSTNTENTLGGDHKEHGKETVALSTITTTENRSSESSEKLQKSDAEQGSTETENTLGVDLKENGKDTVAMSTATTAENHSSESFDKLQENNAEKGSTETTKTLGDDQKDDEKMSTIATTENHSSKSFEKLQENDAEQGSTETRNTLGVDHKEEATAPDDEPDWRQMFLNGMQDREKTLLTEYTNTLRSYKDMKKKLTEIENKNQDNHLDNCLKSQLHDLKTSNSLKDQEIRILHRKLSLLQITLEGNDDTTDSTSILPQEEHDIEKLLSIDQPESVSAIEEKFRSNIDEVLEENLTFWLKFSTTYAEIQRFETTINDLQTEVSKLEKKRKSSEGSNSLKHSLKSDARPIYKHLTVIQTDITVWLEKSALLKQELQRRFSSLCVIQEDITNALKASAEDEDFRFTSYQSAKFQGEVLNMKQENNKVADELQAGLDIVTSLQLEVEKALVKLNEQFELSASKREESGQLSQSESRARVPLRSFIFGVKPKKQSIFSCMAPGMNRKLRSARD